jgi:serine/threonine protein phosphatase PrpC
VLADGQGGRPGGARAAQLACQAAMDAALRLPPARLADGLAWTAVLQDADAAVARDAEAGFTTLLGFWMDEDHLGGASVGDSAVYLMVAGRCTDLTARQHKNPPLGSGAAAITPFAARTTAGAVVLAMSDGVWKYAGRERIVAAGSAWRGQELIDGLQRQTRLPGSGRFADDFTLVVLDCDGRK